MLGTVLISYSCMFDRTLEAKSRYEHRGKHTILIRRSDMGGYMICNFVSAVAYFRRLRIQAVIMVVDSSDTDRLHIAKRELHQMLESEVRGVCLSYMKCKSSAGSPTAQCISHCQMPLS